MITLTGSGLTDEMTITHDNGSCVILNATQSQVICQMMPGVSVSWLFHGNSDGQTLIVVHPCASSFSKQFPQSFETNAAIYKWAKEHVLVKIVMATWTKMAICATLLTVCVVRAGMYMWLKASLLLLMGLEVSLCTDILAALSYRTR